MLFVEQKLHSVPQKKHVLEKLVDVRELLGYLDVVQKCLLAPRFLVEAYVLLDLSECALLRIGAVVQILLFNHFFEVVLVLSFETEAIGGVVKAPYK